MLFRSDTVLMDIGEPTGTSVAWAIKAVQRWPNALLIALTNHADHSSAGLDWRHLVPDWRVSVIDHADFAGYLKHPRCAYPGWRDCCQDQPDTFQPADLPLAELSGLFAAVAERPGDAGRHLALAQRLDDLGAGGSSLLAMVAKLDARLLSDEQREAVADYDAPEYHRPCEHEADAVLLPTADAACQRGAELLGLAGLRPHVRQPREPDYRAGSAHTVPIVVCAAAPEPPRLVSLGRAAAAVRPYAETGLAWGTLPIVMVAGPAAYDQSPALRELTVDGHLALRASLPLSALSALPDLIGRLAPRHREPALAADTAYLALWAEPLSPASLLRFAGLAMVGRDRSLAWCALSHLMAHWPASADGCLATAQLMRQIHGCDAATEWLERAAATEPTHLGGLVLLAHDQTRRRLPGEAIATWRRALQAHPTYAEGWLWLGELLAQGGQKAAATDAWQTALAASEAELPYGEVARWARRRLH